MSRLQKPLRWQHPTYRWVGAALFRGVQALSFTSLLAHSKAESGSLTPPVSEPKPASSAPQSAEAQKPLPRAKNKETKLCCPVDCPCRKGSAPAAQGQALPISAASPTFLPGHEVDSQRALWQSLEAEKAWSEDGEVDSEGVTGHLQTWEAVEGQGLKEALQSWADAVHWKLIWKASCNYPLVSTVRIYGSLDAAIEKLVSAYLYAEQPLRADIYPVQGLIVISNF